MTQLPSLAWMESLNSPLWRGGRVRGASVCGKCSHLITWDAPQTPQDPQSPPQDFPRRTQDHPRHHQDIPKTPQGPPTDLQNTTQDRTRQDKSSKSFKRRRGRRRPASPLFNPCKNSLWTRLASTPPLTRPSRERLPLLQSLLLECKMSTGFWGLGDRCWGRLAAFGGSLGAFM